MTMTPPTDIPHRFAACKNWAWEDHMTVKFARTGMEFVVRKYTEEEEWMYQSSFDGSRRPTAKQRRDAFPVLNPSTMGCILARIRRLRNDPTICPAYAHPNCWALVSRTGERLAAWHDTEEEAYLDGLEGCL